MVPFVAMVDQYGQPYLPAYSMVVPGSQHQVMAQWHTFHALLAEEFPDSRASETALLDACSEGSHCWASRIWVFELVSGHIAGTHVVVPCDMVACTGGPAGMC